MAIVVPFRHLGARSSPLAQFIRLGDHGAQALGDLFAVGHFRPRRVVVDAPRFDRRRELIGALRAAGVEIVLDPKTAELAALGPAGFESFLEEGGRDLSRAEPVRERQAQPDLFTYGGL